MLPRRHIRIKVFQSLYAHTQQIKDPVFNITIEFKNNLALSGWHEVFDVHMKLRAEAKKYWERTGRGEQFVF